MKKKLVGFSLILAVLSACDPDKKKDQEPVGPSYPTNSVTLEAETRVMLTQMVNPMSPSTLFNTILTAQADYELGAAQTALGLAPQGLGMNPWADSIAAGMMLSPSGPTLAVNNETVEQSELPLFMEMVTLAQNKRPVVSVGHTVEENDSAWVVYNKVKFWEDTLGFDFRIATYLLFDIPAARYKSQNLDLRYLDVKDYVNKGDSLSIWARNIPTADSSATVFDKGETFAYRSVMIAPFGNKTFGIPLLDYTIFGPEFYRNDIYGTSSTPIEHYFIKPDAYATDTVEVNFEYSPAFLSVVWAVRDSMGVTTDVEYVNSYISRP